MSQCYINLELYQDALEQANNALQVDDSHVKTLYRKAKSLSLLYKFDESCTIFEQLKEKSELQTIASLKQQLTGDYTKTMKMNEILLKTLPIANFV